MATAGVLSYSTSGDHDRWKRLGGVLPAFLEQVSYTTPYGRKERCGDGGPTRDRVRAIEPHKKTPRSSCQLSLLEAFLSLKTRFSRTQKVGPACIWDLCVECKTETPTNGNTRA